MKEKEVKDKIGHENWIEFLEWMEGQTVGMGEDGTADFYEYDVERFMKGKSPMSHG